MRTILGNMVYQMILPFATCRSYDSQVSLGIGKKTIALDFLFVDRRSRLFAFWGKITMVSLESIESKIIDSRV